MTNENYLIARPQSPMPGCLTIIVPESQSERLAKLENEKKRRIYKVRAIIGENIPLSDELHRLVSLPSKSLMLVNGNPLTINIHNSGHNAVFYDIFPNEKEELSHISVEVEADLPDSTFVVARTAVNQFLDTLMRELWLPLTIIRLDLFVDDSDMPLIHEIHFPFLTKLSFGPLGGYHSFPLLAPYEALAREAIIATSPYYRFLCAFRLAESVKYFRSEIKKYAGTLNVTEPLPRPPQISSEFMFNLGFSENLREKVRIFDDLIKELKQLRNAVSHFLLNRSKSYPLDLSNGSNYRVYASASALLLHYSHEAINDLRIFFNQKISSHLFRGSILAEVENRDSFILKAENYWS